MEDNTADKIRNYCEKVNMKMDQLSIITSEKGYIATDGYTSIMFDEKGVVSSLPMYRLYGNKSAKLFGKSYAICMCAMIIIIFIVVLVSNLIKY